MKKLFFALAVILVFASCKTSYQMTTTTVDFSSYAKNGFLVTTSSIGGAYQSLGIVSSDCQPGYVAQSAPKVSKDKADAIYESTPVKLSGRYGDCNRADLVDALYQQAIQLKANGLIDVRFSDYSIKIGSAYQIYHTATGLAIKTK